MYGLHYKIAKMCSTSLTINWYSLSPKIDKAISIHTASLRELRACEQWHSPIKRYLTYGNNNMKFVTRYLVVGKLIESNL